MAKQTSTSENVEQPCLAKHDPTILDLAFAMDCTGSMGSYIDTARQNIRRIAEEIVAAETSDIRFALVEYRDHPPQDSTFVTRVHDFTPSLGTVKTWLDKCSAKRGGDFPEAVADALHQLLKISWREEATKICVSIADAPPHGLAPGGDTFPNGCPGGLDPLSVTRNLAEKGITIYMVGCEPRIVPYRDFMMTLSYITGGQYVPLKAANLLTQVIIGGAQEEITLERFMEDVNQAVQQEVQASGGRFDDETITRKVHTDMKKKRYRSKHLNLNKASLPCASTQAKTWSGYDNMEAVRKDFKRGKRSSRIRPKKTTPAGSSWGFFSRIYHAVWGSAARPPSTRRRIASASESTSKTVVERGRMSSDVTSEKAVPAGNIWGFFSRLFVAVWGSAAPPPPPPPSSPPGGATSASTSAPVPAARSDDAYNVMEDDISEAQVSRLVQKSKARGKYT